MNHFLEFYKQIKRHREFFRVMRRNSSTDYLTRINFPLPESEYWERTKHEIRGLFYCYKDNFFINIHYVCDGINDCYNGEDELNCSITFYFTCNKHNIKLNVFQICDFINDCPDESDERNCGKINKKKKRNILFIFLIFCIFI